MFASSTGREPYTRIKQKPILKTRNYKIHQNTTNILCMSFIPYRQSKFHSPRWSSGCPLLGKASWWTEPLWHRPKCVATKRNTQAEVFLSISKEDQEWSGLGFIWAPLVTKRSVSKQTRVLVMLISGCLAPTIWHISRPPKCWAKKRVACCSP